MSDNVKTFRDVSEQSLNDLSDSGVMLVGEVADILYGRDTDDLDLGNGSIFELPTTENEDCVVDDDALIDIAVGFAPSEDFYTSEDGDYHPALDRRFE